MNINEKLSLMQDKVITVDDSCPSGVYAILNPKNQIYIGSSTNVERRFYQYRGLYETSQVKLFNSLKKYGVDNHKFFFIEQCDFDQLYEKERFWGEYFQCLNREKGLNLVLPGAGEKKKEMAQEVKDKIGKAHKGKIITTEQRKVISERLKGRKQTQEHIDKRRMFGEKNPAYGKQLRKGCKLTEEQCQRMSDSRKGKGLLGENNNAKQVIDTLTGDIYSSAKEVSIKFGINYSTLKAWLQKINKSDGRFEYVKYLQETTRDTNGIKLS